MNLKKKRKGAPPVQVTSILTVYKRPYLEEQIELVRAQTVPSNIIVWQNENHIDVSDLREKYGFVHIHGNRNFKFHGRFTVPLLVGTPFVCIFDDDTMPQRRWLEKCMRSCVERNAIIGRNGRNIRKGMSGQEGPVPQGADLKVDFVGHSWFFRREWIHHMWREPALTFDNGEDIHFCAAAQIHGGIPSFIAGSDDPEEQALQEGRDGCYGADEFAHYKVHRGKHTAVRMRVWKHWLNRGWKTKHYPNGIGG